jgi:hypothetical protein
MLNRRGFIASLVAAACAPSWAAPLRRYFQPAITSRTVGGINRANFSFWRNQQTSAAQTAAAVERLRAALRQSYDGSRL